MMNVTPFKRVVNTPDVFSWLRSSLAYYSSKSKALAVNSCAELLSVKIVMDEPREYQ
jgi:hypothetical protein